MSDNQSTVMKQCSLCPHLGLQDDAGTALAYPSGLNYCNHARPVVAVDFGHQSTYCLTPDFVNCEQYAKAPGMPLPAVMRMESSGRFTRKWLIGLAAVVVLGLVGVVAWQSRPGGWFNPSGNLFGTDATPTLAMAASDTLAAETTPDAGETVVPVITTTATKRVIGGLETLLGYENSFLIHRMREGESLELLARLYGTAAESITAVNHELPIPLPVNRLLVIPINRVSVAGIPPMEPYMVVHDVMSSDLAETLGVNAADLVKYNNLAEDVMLVAGEWILVPFVQAVP